MEEIKEANPVSCAKCRRRKAKCDRAQPCGNCVKTSSECTYETIFRTPLTRRHLTEVEEELALTKERLKQLETAYKSASPSERNQSNLRKRRATNTAQTETRNEETLYPRIPDTTFMHQEYPMDSYQANVSSTNTSVSVLYQQQENGPKRPRPSKSGGQIGPSPAFSMETPPAGDFDWDERARSNTRFIDGMASLTERSSRGYMGVASGAALLRLADDASADSAVDIDQNETASNTPPVPALFTLAQLEPFVDAYFATYHISYPIVHEATFRAQFMEIIPRPRGNAWQVLLHIVATMGAFAASETAPEIDLALFEAAKSRMTVDMFETGNLTLVQALTLTSNYVQKRNKPNSGYNYLGLAKRMAFGLGLYKEFPAWHKKPLMLETRRRVFWSLYIFDVGAIITFSRPLDFPRDGIEVQLPLNVSDSDITASTKSWPQETEATTLYSHLRSQASFHLRTVGLYERLISTSDFPSAEEMLRLDDQTLGAWLRDLPSYFSEGVPQPPRYRLCHAILQWRWRNMRILMYRPFLVRRFMARTNDNQHPPPATSWDETATRNCLDTAGETVQLITKFWQQERQNVLACWYSLYFLFQAILIPVVCLRNDPFAESALVWRQQILSALATISDMGRLNSAATRCHSTIMNLCGAFLGDNTPPNLTESPQTQLHALQSFMWPIIDPQFMGGYDGFQETAAYDFMTNLGTF